MKFEDTKTLGFKTHVGLDRPNNGVAVATSVQKVGLINFADGFISLKFEDMKNLRLKTHVALDRPDNGVAVATSVRKWAYLSTWFTSLT